MWFAAVRLVIVSCTLALVFVGCGEADRSPSTEDDDRLSATPAVALGTVRRFDVLADGCIVADRSVPVRLRLVGVIDDCRSTLSPPTRTMEVRIERSPEVDADDDIPVLVAVIGTTLRLGPVTDQCTRGRVDVVEGSTLVRVAVVQRPRSGACTLAQIARPAVVIELNEPLGTREVRLRMGAIRNPRGFCSLVAALREFERTGSTAIADELREFLGYARAGSLSEASGGSVLKARLAIDAGADPSATYARLLDDLAFYAAVPDEATCRGVDTALT